MAIVNMKRLRLFGLIRDRDRLFEALQQLGCVEVTEQTDRLADPDWAGLVHPNSSTRSEKERLLEETEAALKVLDEYAPAKSSFFSAKPEVRMEDLFDQDAAADAALKAHEINAYAADLRQNASDQHKVKTTCQTLLPWVSLDIPLTTQSTSSMYVAFGMIPATVDLENVRKDLQLNADASELFLASTDAEMHYLLFCCHRSQEEAALDVLKSYGFSNTTFKGITGTAEETVKYLTKQLATLEQQEASITEALCAYKDARPALQLTADRLSQEIQKELCKERLLDTDTTFFMTGWVSEPEEAELVKTLDSFDCAYELESPTEEEYPSVPVKLKNGKIATSLNTVTEMYSLPQYGSIDPNPLMAPFFILFFGMMMADMAYGLLMFFGCSLIVRKKRLHGSSAHLYNLIKYCGVTSFIFGAVTGSFFGDFLSQAATILGHPGFELPKLFSPMDDALAVMIGSLVLGVIQIFTGMAISMYKQIKRGQVMAALCNEGAWYLVFILLGAAILTPYTTPCLIALLVVIVLTQGYGKKGILGKLSGIGGSLYNNITGYFSDILSYSRLMALMLAGAVIAQVFNTLGSITGNIVGYVIIAMIGNALNLALNLLSCYVHDLRLQCLEFFGRFYEDGGKAFDPVSIQTNYVDVIQ